jgi:hypothetical protein
MPILSRFNGVVVFMNYNDHPPPHFHARHADHEITVEIASGTVVGTFPAGVRRMILKWMILHKAELLDRWSRARSRELLPPIAPLP